MSETYIILEIVSYSLCFLLACYWLRCLSSKLLQYNPSRHWCENAFLESCLLFIYNTFHRVPSLLYVVLDTLDIHPNFYLTSYWSILVLLLVILFLFIQTRRKQNANQTVNDANHPNYQFENCKKERQIAGTTKNDSFKNESGITQEYRSLESGLLDVVIILSIVSMTLGLLCETVLTGFLYSFQGLLHIVHLGLLIRKKLFATDVSSFYWIAYIGLVFVVWCVSRTFYKCTIYQLSLELYTNIWIVYFTITVAACRKFDNAFAEDIFFLSKFLVLFVFICFINSLPVFKQNVVLLVIK